MSEVVPRIRVELYGIPRLRAGRGALDLSARTVAEALEALAACCPALQGSVIVGGTLRPEFRINRNGETFLLDDPATITLAPGDVLIVLSADAGG
jgi:hypothetical protein